MDLRLQALQRDAASGDPTALLDLQRRLLESGLSPASAWESHGVHVGFDPFAPVATLASAQQNYWGAAEAPLTTAEAQSLREDLAHLTIHSLLAGAPRNTRGALQLKARVLLARYETTLTSARGVLRPAFLVTTLPMKRSQPQRVTLDLLCFPGDREKHSWVRERWRWDSRELQLQSVDFNSVQRFLMRPREELTTLAGASDCEEEARVALCLRDLKRGAFQRALALYGVGISPELDALLGGEEPRGLCGGAEVALPAAEKLLGQIAPWLLVETLGCTVQTRRGHGGQGRHAGILLTFPKQRHLRKVRLVLRENKGAPELAIETAGQELPLIPRSSWALPCQLGDLLESLGPLD